MNQNYNFINGNWIKKNIKKKYFIKNFDNKIISSYPDSEKSFLDKAIMRSSKNFLINPFYKKKEKRIKALLEIFNYLKNNKDEIIKAELSETGKKKSSVINEVNSGIQMWKDAAYALKKINFERKINFKNHKLIKRLEPVGVVGLITPWNYPFIVVCERLPFIIAAGCSVILKPSEFAAASMKFIIEGIIKSSAPNNLVSLVFGKGKKIGKAITTNININMISFTGSTKVAREIINSSSTSIKKLSLELGGKNPMIITKTANFKKSIKYILKNFLENAGQACIAGSVLYIEKNIYKRILQLLRTELSQIKNFQNPISQERNKATKLIIKKSLKRGAKLIFGNKNILNNSSPVTPFILSNVKKTDDLYKTEIFGTVLILQKFKKINTLILDLNKNNYGLACFLYTGNKNDKKIFQENIRYGRVWVNESLDYWNPYLTIGGFRNSGYGSETGFEGIKNYLINKSIVSRS